MTRDPSLNPPPLAGRVLCDIIVPARAPWSYSLRRGERLRIIDVEGNQAVDFLAYALADDAERFSHQETIAHQGEIFLKTGAKLFSSEGRLMFTLVATDVARHDMIAGACSCESNTLRYGHHTQAEHACVDNFLIANAWAGRGKRDIVANVNWFMNVPVQSDGALGIVDGISGPGRFVDLVAEMDVEVVVSNCPQINNPCNGFNPTPVRMIVAE